LETPVLKRTAEKYLEIVKKNTEFFSLHTPEDLVNEIGGLLQEQGHTIKLDDKKYKFTVTLNSAPADQDDEEGEAQEGGAAAEKREDSV